MDSAKGSDGKIKDRGLPRLDELVDSQETARSLTGEAVGDNVRNERFYRLLDKLKGHFSYIRKSDGSFTYVSSDVTGLLGYSPEEFTRNWKSYLADNLTNEVGVALFQSGRDPGSDEVFEMELFHKEGHRLWFEVYEYPVLNPAGEVLEVEGVASDITRRKRAEVELRFGWHRFREISESSPIGIFQIDSDDHYVYINTRWQTITGRTLKESLGRIWWQIIHPEDQEAVLRDWAQSEGEGLEFSTQCRILRPNQDIRWVQLRSAFSFHDLGKITYGTIEDITVRKGTEEQLECYAAELKRSNQALQDFASIASHDLQEPLRKIVAFSDRIKTNYGEKLDGQGRDYLERMQSAAERMKRFINDLLEFSRVTTKAKPFEPTDLDTVVSEVLCDLEARIAQTQGKVETDKLPTLLADTFQMRQLFQNLIGNALKFHKKGEPPVVKVSATEGPKKGFWTVIIQDNGIGFDEKYLDRIFKPFERLHGRSEYEGSGIGLAICQKIVERHNGEITAKSKPREGTTFIFTLPEKQKK